MPSFGIILPVRNRKSFTLAILQQLSEQITQQVATDSIQHQDIQIVVVDDDSSDGTPEQIENQFPAVHLLRGDGNLWWTGAIAQGMTYCCDTLKTDYIVWLNDDIVLSGDFISQLSQHCQDPTETVLTGGIITDRNYSNWIVFGGVIASQLINDLKQFDYPILDVDTLNGNIAILPTRIVSDIGLPDVERFRHYGGDFEYVCRAKSKGYKIRLSSYLQATTDYRLADVIRYMPLWIQWVTNNSLSGKWQVLKSLTNRRSPHNVEHMVNSMHRADASVPPWRYVLFYVRKLVKIVGSELVPQTVKQSRIRAYFQRQNVPADIARSVLEKS